MSLWPRTIKTLISNWPRTRKFSHLFKNTGGEDLFLPSWRVDHVQFLCSDFSKFDRWVHAKNLSNILKLVYFDSWSWQSFVSTCDAFNCLFPLEVQNEVHVLSRVFCYSWLVFFFFFLVQRYVACQSRKSDFGWHRFRFSPCLMGIKEGAQFSSDSGVTW